MPDYYQTFFRNYDQALGRFIAIDPLAEQSERLTCYQYSVNNPVMFNDPFGDIQRHLTEMPKEDCGCGGGGSGGGDRVKPGINYNYLTQLGFQAETEGLMIRALSGDPSALEQYVKQNGGAHITDRTQISNFTNAINNGKFSMNGNSFIYTTSVFGTGSLTAQGTYDMNVITTTRKVQLGKGSGIPSNQGSGNHVMETVGNTSGYIGIAADLAYQNGYIATIGSNMKYYRRWTTGNQYVKVFGIAKGLGFLTLGLSSLADITLSSEVNLETGKPYQSWGETGLNAGVSAYSLYLGGGPGLFVGVTYTIGKEYLEYADRNPQYFKDYGILNKY